MAPIRFRERELTHIGITIGLLELLAGHGDHFPSHIVFEPDYWQARLETLAAEVGDSDPLAARASALLARLDALREVI